MNHQIRKGAYTVLVIFGLIFANLARIQIISAAAIASDDRNVRALIAEYAIERGAILSADNQTLAESIPTPDAELKFSRTYPAGGLFAHVTGFHSVRFGREGLERFYNSVLSGRGGVLTMQDLGDRLLSSGEKGDSIRITIDSRLQETALSALEGRRGAVVALDPLTGQILAFVSSPTFDPNPLAQHSGEGQGEAMAVLEADPNKPLLSRAANESYPPGSTFKVVTAAAALESGRGPETAFPASDQYIAPQTDRPIRNFGGGTCGGDMTQSFRVSCNTYFAQLAAELPAGILEETARALGFEERAPIDIRAAASRLPSEESLRSPAFRAQAGIGQFEVSATPLQMALVASAMAHGGRIVTPKFLKEVIDPRGTRIREEQPAVWREAVSSETAATIKEMMVTAVASGTGTRAQLPGVRVAGKTGTAQTGIEGLSHSWFIGFAPADSPRIAVAVLVEGSGEGLEETGGRVAAPIARVVMEKHREIAGW